jgi:hypothetical protein
MANGRRQENSAMAAIQRMEHGIPPKRSMLPAVVFSRVL